MGNSIPRSGRADQFSNRRSTGILPVAERHGQDARATPDFVTQLEELIGPARSGPIAAIPEMKYNHGGAAESLAVWRWGGETNEPVFAGSGAQAENPRPGHFQALARQLTP